MSGKSFLQEENGERNMKHSEFASDCVFCVIGLYAGDVSAIGRLDGAIVCVEEIRNVQLVSSIALDLAEIECDRARE